MSALPSQVIVTAPQEQDDTRNHDPQMLTVPIAAEAPDSRGVSVERLDASVLLAVSLLLPKDRGRSFVASLLRYAIVKQVEVPGRGLVDAAVILLPNIERFAHHHKQSKDTALRYLDMLQALGILYRYRHANQTELHLPLTVWSPSAEALLALDALLVEDAARAKLQQLANSVKARFLLLYGSPESRASLFGDLQGTLTDIQELLSRRVSSAKRHLLQQRIENLLKRLDGPEGSSLKEGDLAQTHIGSPAAHTAQQGDFQNGPGSLNGSVTAQPGDLRDAHSAHLAQKGDPAVASRQRHGALTAQERDLQSGPEELQAPVTAERGDFQEARPSDLYAYGAQKGDLQDGQEGTDGLISPQKGDFGIAQSGGQPIDQAEKGDFQMQYTLRANQKGDFQEASVTPSLNVNVITPPYDTTGEENVNVNDSHALASMTNSEDRYTQQEAVQVGRSLAQFLEPNLGQMTSAQQRRTIGGFVNKCKNCSRTTIRAAVIDVLVHAHFPLVDPSDTRGAPDNRGAWFHGACDRYAVPGMPIPAFVQKWLVTDLSWRAIEEALQDAATRYQAAMLSGSRSRDLVQHWLSGKLSQQELDEALRQVEAAQGKRLRTPAEAKGWMDQDEAGRAARRIRWDAAAYGITDARARPERGAFVVDLFRGGKRSLTLKHPAEWTELLEALRLQAAMRGRERK